MLKNGLLGFDKRMSFNIRIRVIGTLLGFHTTQKAELPIQVPHVSFMYTQAFGFAVGFGIRAHAQPENAQKDFTVHTRLTLINAL